MKTQALGPTQKAAVDAVRQIAKGLDDYTDEALLQVIRKCERDVDLAITALTMIPRPDWVTEILSV